MIYINVTIQGKTPLICNRFTDAAQEAATNGTRSSVIGDKGTPLQQAEPKLYIGIDGKPMIPQPNMFRCIIDAGKFFKAGKSKITTTKNSLIPACVEVEGIKNGVEIPIIHREPWTVDTRPVCIPSTGGRILAHRPKFNDWKLRFAINLDESMISENLLREIIDDAGRKIGLGDFRPDRKGPFGRFFVIEWKSEKVK